MASNRLDIEISKSQFADKLKVDCPQLKSQSMDVMKALQTPVG